MAFQSEMKSFYRKIWPEPIRIMKSKFDRRTRISLKEKALGLIFGGLIIIILVTSCNNIKPLEDFNQPSAIVLKSTSQPTVIDPTVTETDMPLHGINISASGPLLLVQTGPSTYQILDVHNQTAYPFIPPGRGQQYYLSPNLSPSSRQMIFPVSEKEVQVMALETGQILARYILESGPAFNNLVQAAQEAQQSLPDLNYTGEELRFALQNALTRSKLNIRWYQSDRYLLSVLEGSQTSTHLYLDDQETGQRHQLEHMPALVEDYWIGPGGEYILLKKGFVFDSGVWQDDRYYLVDVNSRSAQPIPLPPDADHPAAYWFDKSYIGITHKTQPIGGVGFSILDQKTMGLTGILKGAFTHLSSYQEHLFVMRLGSAAGTTEIALYTQAGEVVQSNTIEGQCFYKRMLEDKILLNCDSDSRIINANLEVETFGDPIFILSSSPDGAHHILVNRNETTHLLDASLTDRQPLILEGPPLEIRWLPDSSGFIYRMRGNLYYFSLDTFASIFLLESELFDDYTNINAVWINLD